MKIKSYIASVLLAIGCSDIALSQTTACNIFFAPNIAEGLEASENFCAGDKSLVPSNYEDLMFFSYDDIGNVKGYVKGQYVYLAYDKEVLARLAEKYSRGNEFIALGLLATEGGIAIMNAVGAFGAGYIATKFLDRITGPQ